LSVGTSVAGDWFGSQGGRSGRYGGAAACAARVLWLNAVFLVGANVCGVGFGADCGGAARAVQEIVKDPGGTVIAELGERLDSDSLLGF